MIPFIIGAVVGSVVTYFIEEDKIAADKKKQSNTFKDFFIIVTSEQTFDKATLTFYSYEEAKQMYDKIVKSKKIKYQDIIDNSEFEKTHHEEALAKGYKKEDGVLNPAESYDVESVTFGKGDDEFETKEF